MRGRRGTLSLPVKSKFIVNKGGSGRARSLCGPELSEAEYGGAAWARERGPGQPGSSGYGRRAGAGSRAAEEFQGTGEGRSRVPWQPRSSRVRGEGRGRIPGQSGSSRVRGRAGAGCRAAEADAERIGKRRGEPRGATQARERAPRGGSTLLGSISPTERGRGQRPSRSGEAEMQG